MRMIGSLPDESVARTFGDYLLTLGIDSHVEESSQGYAIWVEHDDHLEKAKSELDAFRTNPDDPRYSAATKQADDVRAKREKAAERRQKNFTDVRTSWAQAATRPTPVTVAVMVLCIVVAGATFLGAKESAVEPLLIVPVLEWVGEYGARVGTLHDTITRHQYWRFISPIFVHHGPLHLLFNMSMLLNFGGLIERHKGSWWLIFLIVATAIPSNLLQYRLGSPFFGGMSGVIYALFGYIWMKGKYQPHEGLNIDLSTVYFLLIWLVLCMVVFSGIANTAHVVGLLSGMALGAGPFYWKQLRRRAGT